MRRAATAPGRAGRIIGQLFKKMGRSLIGDYRLNRIYKLELESFEPPPLTASFQLRRITGDDIERSPMAALRARSSYDGENAMGFGVFDDGALVGTCWFWNHRRFKDESLWPLRDREAVLVDLLTCESHRGRGMAPAVTAFAAGALKKAGYETLYASVWHSNRPSIRSFEKAGWSYAAFVVNVEAPITRRPIRWCRWVENEAGRPRQSGYGLVGKST